MAQLSIILLPGLGAKKVHWAQAEHLILSMPRKSLTGARQKQISLILKPRLLKSILIVFTSGKVRREATVTNGMIYVRGPRTMTPRRNYFSWDGFLRKITRSIRTRPNTKDGGTVRSPRKSKR